MSKLPEPRSDAEIRELVFAWLSGLVYTSETVPPDSLAMVFVPITLGGLADWSDEEIRQIVFLGVLTKHATAGRSVNGYPIFMECSLWLETDVAKVVRLVNEVKDAQEKILGGR